MRIELITLLLILSSCVFMIEKLTFLDQPEFYFVTIILPDILQLKAWEDVICKTVQKEGRQDVKKYAYNMYIVHAMYKQTQVPTIRSSA